MTTNAQAWQILSEAPAEGPGPRPTKPPFHPSCAGDEVSDANIGAMAYHLGPYRDITLPGDPVSGSIDRTNARLRLARAKEILAATLPPCDITIHWDSASSQWVNGNSDMGALEDVVHLLQKGQRVRVVGQGYDVTVEDPRLVAQARASRELWAEGGRLREASSDERSVEELGDGTREPDPRDFGVAALSVVIDALHERGIEVELEPNAGDGEGYKLWCPPYGAVVEYHAYPGHGTSRQWFPTLRDAVHGFVTHLDEERLEEINRHLVTDYDRREGCRTLRQRAQDVLLSWYLGADGVGRGAVKVIDMTPEGSSGSLYVRMWGLGRDATVVELTALLGGAA